MEIFVSRFFSKQTITIMKQLILIGSIFYLIVNSYAQIDKITRKQMYRDYDQFVSIVEQCNGQLPVRRAVTGINQIDNILSLRTDIDTITSLNSFVRLLNKSLSSLYDIHAYQTLDIYPEFDNLKKIDTSNIAPKVPVKFPQKREDMVLLGNPLYINHEYYLPYIYTFITQDSDTMVFQYSKIVAYNGVPFPKYVKENLNKFHFSGTIWDYEKKEYASNYVSIPYCGLLTLEENGAEKTIDLNRVRGTLLSSADLKDTNIAQVNGFHTYNRVEYFEKGSILYIYLGEMMGEGSICSTIKSYEGKPISKIIIDVRGNVGGSDQYWFDILQSITADTLWYSPMLAFKNTRMIRKSHKFEGGDGYLLNMKPMTFSWLPDVEYLVLQYAKPLVPDSNSLKYKGPIYVLQNQFVYSSGHSLPSFASVNDQLISVGQPTGLLAGCGINPMLFQLKNSKFTFRLETAIDITNAQNPLDVYQDIPEIVVEIPTQEQLDYFKYQNYDRQSEAFLFKYDFLFNYVLKLP